MVKRDALFKVTSQMLEEFAADPKYGLGGRIGFTVVLHTWDQKLLGHFHLHCVVAGGALSFDGNCSQHGYMRTTRSRPTGARYTMISAHFWMMLSRVTFEVSSTTCTSRPSSLPARTAQRIAVALPNHWCVENQLHWSLDVCFGEDHSRVRMGNAAENLSRVRRLALTLLKQEETAKVGIKAKRLMAGWDEKYLLRVLKI